MGNTASGPGAYTLNFTPENRIGEGTYADVYKVQKKDTKEWCAAKLHKIPLSFFDSLQKLGYDRELEILKETDHPFVIKYKDEFVY